MLNWIPDKEIDSLTDSEPKDVDNWIPDKEIDSLIDSEPNPVLNCKPDSPTTSVIEVVTEPKLVLNWIPDSPIDIDVETNAKELPIYVLSIYPSPKYKLYVDRAVLPVRFTDAT